MTAFIYMLPLGAGGMRKPWGMSNSSFPCCWGTLTEQFSKMADSIYSGDPQLRTPWATSKLEQVQILER